jgi:hypothetical protein
MFTLSEVINKFYEGKAYRRTLSDGSSEQLTPLLPLAMHEYRYTFMNPDGEFREWCTLAMEFVLDPHSGIGADNWVEV